MLPVVCLSQCAKHGGLILPYNFNVVYSLQGMFITSIFLELTTALHRRQGKYYNVNTISLFIKVSNEKFHDD